VPCPSFSYFGPIPLYAALSLAFSQGIKDRDFLDLFGVIKTLIFFFNFSLIFPHWLFGLGLLLGNPPILNFVTLCSVHE